MTVINDKRKVYKIAVQDEKYIYWIHESVMTMSWSGSRNEASRTLSFECVKLPDKSTDFREGSAVVIYDSQDTSELMRYYITKKSLSGSSDTIKYSARDIRWWLIRSTYDKKFENKSASDIVNELCLIFEIPVGEIANTAEKFDCLHFIKMTPWDMIITALTETKKLTGKQYTIKIVNGKLSLLEKKNAVNRWIIEGGVNLLDSSYDQSIEETYTQVKVTGKDKDGNVISVVEKESEQQKLYGIMQEYIEQTEETTEAKINKIAKEKLKELAVLKKGGSITTFGIDGVEAGDAIYVKDEQTGMIGGFYIESDNHSYSNCIHKMSLTLAWTDELPELDYKASST